MKGLVVGFVAAVTGASVLTMIIEPEQLLKTIFMSPQGLVLIGRAMLAYSVVFPATGSHFAGIFSGIFFNNTVSFMTVLTVPAVIYYMYKRNARTRSETSRTLSWRRCQRTMKIIAATYVGMFGFALATVLLAKGPAVFMPFESLHVFMVSALVYRAAGLTEQDFAGHYLPAVGKISPHVVLLVALAAFLETYEIIHAAAP